MIQKLQCACLSALPPLLLFCPRPFLSAADVAQIAAGTQPLLVELLVLATTLLLPASLLPLQVVYTGAKLPVGDTAAAGAITTVQQLCQQ